MKDWSRRAKRLIAWLMAAVFLTISIAGTETAFAEGENRISWQPVVGYNGVYKDSKWYPVKLTLTNESDKTRKGELVLSVLNRDGLTTDYIRQVELPPASPVEVTFGLPGVTLGKDTNRLTFYEGGYKSKNGKIIPLIGNDYLSGITSTSYMIGVISRDPDTLNFMPMLNQKGYDIKVIPLTPEEMPVDGLLNDMLDALVINDIAANWKDEQIDAIKDWTARGGTLILSGGAGYGKTAEAFKELAPVAMDGTTQLELGEATTLLSIGGAGYDGGKSVTLSTGAVTDGSVLLNEGGQAIAVSRGYGFGKVTYVAFDPSLEPMATWPGSAPLWSRMLQISTSIGGVAGLGSINYSYDNSFWNMSQLLDQFPSISAPPFGLLLLLLSIYILIVAPVLYLILAKADRREWGWWLIPALSLAMGVSIFMFGSSDKRAVSSHLIEVVEFAEDGKSAITSGAGIFSPTGGTVTMTIPADHTLRLFSDMSGLGGLAMNGRNQIRLGDESNTAVWQSVPYWSTRKVWMERRMAEAEETGTLDVQYETQNGATKIIVTNQTTSDLRDVHLLYGGTSVKIRDLKIGESGSAIQPANANLNVNNFNYYNYGYTVFPNYDEHRRERDLLDTIVRSNYEKMGTSASIVVGFAVDQENPYLVNGQKVKTDRLRLVFKRLEGKQEIDGLVNVPPSAMQPISLSNTLEYFYNNGNETARVGPGELELEYLVPDSYLVAYDTMDVSFFQNQYANMTWSIWHQGSGEWVELNGSLGSPSEYMTESHSIRVKLVAASEGEVSLPQISLQGKVLQ